MTSEEAQPLASGLTTGIVEILLQTRTPTTRKHVAGNVSLQGFSDLKG